MKDRKALNKLREKHLIDSLKKVEHPLATSLGIAFALYIALVVIAVVASLTKKVTFNSAMLTSGAISIVLAMIWSTLRVGLFSGVRLRFVNYRNNRIAKTVTPNPKISLSKKEFEELAKQRSWWGIIALALAGCLTVLVTALIQFL